MLCGLPGLFPGRPLFDRLEDAKGRLFVLSLLHRKTCEYVVKYQNQSVSKQYRWISDNKGAFTRAITLPVASAVIIVPSRIPVKW